MLKSTKKLPQPVLLTMTGGAVVYAAPALESTTPDPYTGTGLEINKGGAHFLKTFSVYILLMSSESANMKKRRNYFKICERRRRKQKFCDFI